MPRTLRRPPRSRVARLLLPRCTPAARARRDDAVLLYLWYHPNSELHEIAAGLRRSRLSAHRSLQRLSRQGRVLVGYESGDFYVCTVYSTTAPPRIPAPRTGPDNA